MTCSPSITNHDRPVSGGRGAGYYRCSRAIERFWDAQRHFAEMDILLVQDSFGDPEAEKIHDEVTAAVWGLAAAPAHVPEHIEAKTHVLQVSKTMLGEPLDAREEALIASIRFDLQRLQNHGLGR